MQLEANLEEELVIWPVEDILEVGQGDPVRTHGQLDQVRSVLVIDVVDHLDRRLQRGELEQKSPSFPPLVRPS